MLDLTSCRAEWSARACMADGCCLSGSVSFMMCTEGQPSKAWWLGSTVCFASTEGLGHGPCADAVCAECAMRGERQLNERPHVSVCVLVTAYV